MYDFYPESVLNVHYICGIDKTNSMESGKPIIDGVLKIHKSYSPEEVLSAGGTTAFGLKTLKDKAEIIKAIENAPPIEPFSDEEWLDLMVQLESHK